MEHETITGDPKRCYKDTLFRKLFNDKNKLLSLYNAVNGSQHENVEDLEINTLDNAIYLNHKNDLSFLFDFYVNIYEHQSTTNPNMPLRNLFHVARLLEKIILQQSLYRSTLLKIPTPRFVVFYNGTTTQPERDILKLSSAFQQQMETPDLELRVVMLNVNIGHNQELMEACQTLKEYAIYVEKVRHYAKEMDIHLAVERAVTESINEDILADFLIKERAEAIQLSIFEYDEEKEMRLLREAERESGYDEGRLAGKEEGKAELLLITLRKLQQKGFCLKEITDFLDIPIVIVNELLDLLSTDIARSDEECIQRILELTQENR